VTVQECGVGPSDLAAIEHQVRDGNVNVAASLVSPIGMISGASPYRGDAEITVSGTLCEVSTVLVGRAALAERQPRPPLRRARGGTPDGGPIPLHRYRQPPRL
jgi:hypothetical protein